MHKCTNKHDAEGVEGKSGKVGKKVMGNMGKENEMQMVQAPKKRQTDREVNRCRPRCL
jgi:hypothetical protein